VERLGHDIERTLAASGGGTVLALSEITSVWPAAVGVAVARQAWPLRLGRDGTLHVATASATWAYELDRLAPEIEEKLRAFLGDAAPPALRFRPGPLPEPDRASDDVAVGILGPPEPSAEAASAAEAIAAAIEDPDLREIVEKAARESLERGRSDRRF
jgi:hypothetical protein